MLYMTGDHENFGLTGVQVWHVDLAHIAETVDECQGGGSLCGWAREDYACQYIHKDPLREGWGPYCLRCIPRIRRNQHKCHQALYTLP